MYLLTAHDKVRRVKWYIVRVGTSFETDDPTVRLHTWVPNVMTSILFAFVGL